MDPKKLRERRAAVWSQMQEIRDRSGDTMTAEDRAAWDAAEADLQQLTDDLERAERAERLAAVDYRDVVDGAREVRAGDGSTHREPVVDDEGNTAADYRTAWDLWARFGTGELTGEQRAILRSGGLEQSLDASEVRALRAQGIGTQAAGGYTVPPEFRNRLVEVLRAFSGVRQVADSITTDTGAPLPWMTNDDTGNVGAILGENTQVTEQDLVFGASSLDVFMYTSKLVRVSLQLIQDSAVNLDQFLPRKLGERIGRIQNQHFTTGTGTAQPLGLVTGGTAVAAATGNATGFTYDSIVDATALRLDPAYLTGGNLAWMGSQAALAGFRKLKDTNGRPLWEPSLQVGAPDTLLGYRYVLNNDMPAPAANAKSLAFGDFRAGYIVRDVTGVQTLRLGERYADYLQVGFLAFQRAGGTVQDAKAYTVLQNSAT